ncbi:unnamed protein product [Orchesella dallaii]|uniref:Uncharacterized protein n=1 Tax=Orchesella dallaii TaxID=48710 RepID=A0ABP1R4I3_9HEXA
MHVKEVDLEDKPLYQGKLQYQEPMQFDLAAATIFVETYFSKDSTVSEMWYWWWRHGRRKASVFCTSQRALDKLGTGSHVSENLWG